MSFRPHRGLSLSKRVLVVFGLLIIISGVFGLVYAYFTGTSIAQALTLQAANLAIEISDPVKDSDQPLLPGETQSATWEIKNTGNVSEQVKFKFAKNLIDGGSLDSLKIIDIAYDHNGSWVSWITTANGIDQEVFWSTTGNETDLKTLSAGEAVKIKVSYQLDGNTPDEMQNKSWEIILHGAAKQINPGANWPTSY